MSGPRTLDLSGSALDDAAFARTPLPDTLQSLRLDWTRVTDGGLARLSRLSSLRHLSLVGTATGDGAIRAMAGSAALADFRSGDRVTDAGLAHLHDLPVFKSWRGGRPRMDLMSYDAEPNYLLLRGALTDAGMRRLVGLDGLFALNLDSDRLSLTAAGVAPLAALPRLAWLGFPADDEAMGEIASLPQLRFLMCQDTPAGDDGFVRLSRSRSIEMIWGRRCARLGARGFAALAGMPALAALSVSCRNVGEGLAALRDFPRLTRLMPVDAPDEGYRHIGACERLEDLTLMYCRETTDAATRHIARLPRLKRYFASYTRITDLTPAILATMASLEEITFDSCAGLTDAGIGALAALPNLRRLSLSGMSGVTAQIRRRFGAGVAVTLSA